MMKRLGLIIGLVIAVAAVVVLVVTSRDNGGTGLPTKVRVAVILPQTGPQAAIGRGAINSVRLAFDLAREELAKKGVECELVFLDDASKPETAVAAAQRASSNKDVLLAVAHFNSPCALATVGIFHEAGLPLIIPAAVNSKVTAKGYREVVRTCNTDIGQAVHMAKFLTATLEARRIYSIHDSSAFGKGLVGALEAKLAEQNVKFAGKDTFHVGDVDFSPVLSRIRAASPDAIVVGCMATEGALFRKQMVEKNMTIPLVGFSGIFYETFLRNAGSAAEGTVAIFPLPPLEEVPGGKDFVGAYQKAGFKEPFESAGPFGYVAGQVAVQTLLAGALSRPAAVDHLRSSTFDTAFGTLRFDDRGEMNLRMFSFYEVRDGKWVVTHRIDEGGNVVPVE